MLFIFSALLMFKTGCCKENQTILTKTVDVGQNVTLMCPHEKAPLYQETWFWIRFVSGTWPEFLGAAVNFNFDGVTKTPHIKIKQEEGTLILQINRTKLNDTGLYYCVKVKQLEVTFITGSFLKIKGSESDITAVIQEAPSDPARPGDPVTLQCSVLSDTERKTCSADPRVFWFRAGSEETHPKLIYTHENRSQYCEKSHEADFTQECVYNFSRNISPSDTGTYFCAAATCGEILFGNGIKLNTEGPKIAQILLCAALSASLAVIFCLICAIRKKNCGHCRCSSDAAADRSEQRVQQRDEHTLCYSAPTFTKRNGAKAERRREKTAQTETVYNDLKTVHGK